MFLNLHGLSLYLILKIIFQYLHTQHQFHKFVFINHLNLSLSKCHEIEPVANLCPIRIAHFNYLFFLMSVLWKTNWSMINFATLLLLLGKLLTKSIRNARISCKRPQIVIADIIYNFLKLCYLHDRGFLSCSGKAVWDYFFYYSCYVREETRNPAGFPQIRSRVV